MEAGGQKLKQIQSALDSVYRARSAAFAKTARREQELRLAIKRLRADTSRATRETDTEMKAIGVDLAWRAWTERQIEQMNLELAQVMVQLEHEKQVLRKDFGRLTAATQIGEKQQEETKRLRQKNTERDILDL